MNAWRLLGFSVDYLNLACALPSELPEHRERCGLLLLTGPANSGKTSLLRALVCAVADPHEVSAVLPTVSREDRCESTQHVHLAHCGSEMRASSRVRYDDRVWTCSGNTTYNPLGVEYRPLLTSEMLAAQGFPRDYKLPDGIKRGDVCRAVGNAVAVPVAKVIAESIMEAHTCS